MPSPSSCVRGARNQDPGRKKQRERTKIEQHIELEMVEEHQKTSFKTSSEQSQHEDHVADQVHLDSDKLIHGCTRYRNCTMNDVQTVTY